MLTSLRTSVGLHRRKYEVWTPPTPTTALNVPVPYKQKRYQQASGSSFSECSDYGRTGNKKTRRPHMLSTSWWRGVCSGPQRISEQPFRLSITSLPVAAFLELKFTAC